MKAIKYRGCRYVEISAAKESPEAYKKRTGKCPSGMHTDAKTGKCRPLLELGNEGQMHILKHPEVATVKHKQFLGRTPLHYLMQAANKPSSIRKIVAHPDSAKVADDEGKTPLHLLAQDYAHHAIALEHPDVAKVRDEDGNTPLHLMATLASPSATKHPEYTKVKNNKGETPKDVRKRSQGASNYLPSNKQYPEIKPKK